MSRKHLSPLTDFLKLCSVIVQTLVSSSFCVNSCMAFMAQVIGFKNVSGTVYVQGQHVGHTGVSGATATETNGMIIFNFLHVYYSPHWFHHWSLRS